MEWKSNRRVLIIAGPKPISAESLAPHEGLAAKNLNAAFHHISSSRPDLVIYFAKGKDDNLEEHVLTWLIEGFHGKFLLFDTMNRVKDSAVLLQSQVIDDYFSGPVGSERFLTIIKNRLSHESHFAPPRAMTTFDLFRNLFERGLDAIFFFNEELTHCVAANIRAEQVTGLSLDELRHSSLRDLCVEGEYEDTLRTIRRAGRHYYDSRGTTVLKGAGGRQIQAAFSCGVFGFGRKNFVKLEVQSLPTALGKASPLPKGKGAAERASHPVLHSPG